MYIWWRVLTSFWTVLEIEFLPVYVPSAAEQKDANLFAENVRRFMAAKSGREISEFGFEDCRLVQAGVGGGWGWAFKRVTPGACKRVTPGVKGVVVV